MHKINTVLALVILFSLSACEDMKMDRKVSQQITIQ